MRPNATTEGTTGTGLLKGSRPLTLGLVLTVLSNKVDVVERVADATIFEICENEGETRPAERDQDPPKEKGKKEERRSIHKVRRRLQFRRRLLSLCLDLDSFEERWWSERRRRKRSKRR